MQNDALVLISGFLALVSALGVIMVLAGLQQRFFYRRRVLVRLRRLLGQIDRQELPTASIRRGRAAIIVTDRLKRAGLMPAAWMQPAAIVLLLLSMLSGAAGHGPAGLLLYPVAALGAIWFLLAYLAGRRRRLMIEQIPIFIDHLLRAVATGNTLDAALMAATAESRDPLRAVFEQVARDLKLGGRLEEALDEVTRTYDLDELRILALAVRVNRRYGSSIQDLLKSVVTIIRRAEAARREFKSMTGETRLSAWVLGLLPISLAGFIMLTNPGYLGNLLYDPGGRVALALALGLQGLGAFILWRMTRVF